MNRPRRQIPAAVVLEVRNMRAAGRSPPRIAQELGLSIETVKAILAGRAGENVH